MAILDRINVRYFFDRKVVIDALDAAKLKALSKAGAFVWRRARTSIRKSRRTPAKDLTPAQAEEYYRQRAEARRRGEALPRRPLQSSEPGKPPRTPTGQYPKTILFAYDPGRESVVVGPRADFNGARQSPKAPEALEFGGIVRRGNRTYRYRARPHMFPALLAESPKFPQLFANTFRRL